MDVLMVTQMALQTAQLLQQLNTVLAQAAQEGRNELTEAEITRITSQYTGVHSQVDAFLQAAKAKAKAAGTASPPSS
jgi:hypothetical protein